MLAQGNTTGLDGLATGQQAFVDVAAHAQAALPHLQAIASAAQTGNRALNTAAVNMGGTVVPLPSSSTSAPLCAAAPSSAASQLAPSGSTGAAQPNAAPAAASDNRFRKGSSLQDTDVTRLLVRAPSTPAATAAPQAPSRQLALPPHPARRLARTRCCTARWRTHALERERAPRVLRLLSHSL